MKIQRAGALNYLEGEVGLMLRMEGVQDSRIHTRKWLTLISPDSEEASERIQRYLISKGYLWPGDDDLQGVPQYLHACTLCIYVATKEIKYSSSSAKEHAQQVSAWRDAPLIVISTVTDIVGRLDNFEI